MRIVIDTNVVVSALVFSGGHLGWLRTAWQTGLVKPLVSKPVVGELIDVLKYPKFDIDADEREQMLAEYLPYCEVVTPSRKHSGLKCRDPEDVKFLQLAAEGCADFLVTGDSDLLSVAVQGVVVITPGDLRDRLTRSAHEQRSERYRVAAARRYHRRQSLEMSLGPPRGKEML